MTTACRFPRASHRGFLANRRRESAWPPVGHGVWLLAVLPAVTAPLGAQARGDAPVAPAATIGPATDRSTLSLLGLASLPDGSGGSLTHRNDLWLGATQALGRLGRVRLSAIGSGNVRMQSGVRAQPAADGQLAIRGRLRVGEHRVWTAMTYGYGAFDGTPSADVVIDGTMADRSSTLLGAAMAGRTDTTVSRRTDIGQFGRAEAGILSRYGGVEFAIGVSVERFVQLTTQTLQIATRDVMTTPPSAIETLPDGTNAPALRTRVQRDLATGIASMGFETGATDWLVSVTAPIATWMRGDALAPRPRAVPTVASVAFIQPVTEWLAFVGAAATNAATVGAGPLQAEIRDNVRGSRQAAFAPVVALGLRLSRLPWSTGEGTPDGVLGFETRTLGAVDAVSVEQGPSPDPTSDTLRVVLLVDAPRAESVEIMGDATAWTITSMRRQPSGRWRAELRLPPGMHRVAVRTDGGKWVAPPGIPVGHDEFGSGVGLLHVRTRR